MTGIEERTNSLTPSFGLPALHDSIHMSERRPTLPAQRLVLVPSDKVADAVPDAGHILVTCVFRWASGTAQKLYR